MKEIGLRVRAKINLVLDVEGRYADGYHRLDMFNTSADICDTLRIREGRGGFIMDGAPCGADNTASKAAALVRFRFGLELEGEIVKGIPVCAGLGGSSADAAAVLCCAGLAGVPPAELLSAAAEIGCDVPYMLSGGGARVGGRGEEITYFKNPDMYCVIAQKSIGASTAAVYREYDADPIVLGDAERRIREVAEKREGFANALTAAASRLCPDIERAMNDLRRYTDRVFMTGSGSAAVGVFEGEKAAARCAAALQGYRFVAATRTCDCGMEIIG